MTIVFRILRYRFYIDWRLICKVDRHKIGVAYAAEPEKEKKANRFFAWGANAYKPVKVLPMPEARDSRGNVVTYKTGYRGGL